MIGDAQQSNAAIEATEQSAVYARGQFETLMAKSELETQWRHGEGIPVEVGSAEAGRADLLIIGGCRRQESDGGFYLLDASDIVVTSGRPVIVVPEGPPAAFTTKRMALAWENTRVSARSAHDALPFREQADEAMLTEVVSTGLASRYEIPITAMAEHLRGHGVNLTIHQLHSATQEPSDLQADFASEQRGDLIVAGAYGHSRMREWVLGGVTATLLNRAEMPCLFAH